MVSLSHLFCPLFFPDSSLTLLKIQHRKPMRSQDEIYKRDRSVAMIDTERLATSWEVTPKLGYDAPTKTLHRRRGFDWKLDLNIIGLFHYISLLPLCLVNYWLLPVHFFLPIQYLDFCVWTRGPGMGSSLTQWIQYFFKCHQEMHSILLGRIIAWSHSPFGCKHVFFLRSWNRLRQESTDVNWLSVLLCISKRIAVKSHVVCHTGLLRLIFFAGVPVSLS